MFWGKPDKAGGPDKPKPFDANALPATKQLPKDLQNMIDKDDKEDSIYDDLISGYESTESNVRYAAYAARLRTVLMSAHRYVAYTSDVGESFRPVAHPRLVRAAYGVSWAYILGDVSYEGYKAYLTNQRVLNPGRALSDRQKRLAGVPEPGGGIFQNSHDAYTGKTVPPATSLEPGVVAPIDDWRTIVVQRALFQSIASMGLPALTIHSVVRYSGQALKNAKSARLRTWAPIGLGLAIVPMLPTLFDKPVENAVEYVFHHGFAAVGGASAVGNAPVTGREQQLNQGRKEL